MSPKAQLSYMPVFFICQASVLIKYQMVFKYQNGSVFPSSVMSCGERKTRTPLIIHTWVLYDDTTTGSYGCSLNLHLGKWGKPDCVHDIYQPATLQHKWWLGKVIRSKERCFSTKLDTVIQVNRFQRSEIWTFIDIYLFLSFPSHNSTAPHTLTNSTRLVCLTQKGYCRSSIFLTSSCSGEQYITYHLTAGCQQEK